MCVCDVIGWVWGPCVRVLWAGRDVCGMDWRRPVGLASNFWNVMSRGNSSSSLTGIIGNSGHSSDTRSAQRQLPPLPPIRYEMSSLSGTVFGKVDAEPRLTSTDNEALLSSSYFDENMRSFDLELPDISYIVLQSV